MVASQGCLLVAVLLPEGPTPINAYWFALFVLVNLVRIYMLYVERRPVEMSADEKSVYESNFSHWKPREFKRLIRLARWRELGPDEKIISQGSKMEHLMLVVSGQVIVKRKGQVLGRLDKGQFVGEMSYLTSQEASADAITEGDVKVLEWSQMGLRHFLHKRPHLQPEIQAAIGKDLIRKLQAPFMEKEVSSSGATIH